jgi:hypothetical protein
MLPAMPGGSPLGAGGSGLGLLVAPPAGGNGIGFELSPSPHAKIVIKGTVQRETTNDRLPNIVIFLHHAPSAERPRQTGRSSAMPRSRRAQTIF